MRPLHSPLALSGRRSLLPDTPRSRSRRRVAVYSVEWGQPHYTEAVALLGILSVLILLLTLPQPFVPERAQAGRHVPFTSTSRSADAGAVRKGDRLRKWWLKTTADISVADPSPPSPPRRRKPLSWLVSVACAAWASTRPPLPPLPPPKTGLPLVQEHYGALLEMCRTIAAVMLLRRCIRLVPAAVRSVRRWQPDAIGGAVSLGFLEDGRLDISWVRIGNGPVDKWRRLALALQLSHKPPVYSPTVGQLERGELASRESHPRPQTFEEIQTPQRTGPRRSLASSLDAASPSWLSVTSGLVQEETTATSRSPRTRLPERLVSPIRSPSAVSPRVRLPTRPETPPALRCRQEGRECIPGPKRLFPEGEHTSPPFIRTKSGLETDMLRSPFSNSSADSSLSARVDITHSAFDVCRIPPAQVERCSLQLGRISAQSFVCGPVAAAMADSLGDPPVLSLMLEAEEVPIGTPPCIARSLLCAASSASVGAGVLSFGLPYDAFSAVAAQLQLAHSGRSGHCSSRHLEPWVAFVPRRIYSSRTREAFTFVLSVVVPTASLAWAAWALYANVALIERAVAWVRDALIQAATAFVGERLGPLIRLSRWILAHLDDALRTATVEFYARLRPAIVVAMPLLRQLDSAVRGLAPIGQAAAEAVAHTVHGIRRVAAPVQAIWDATCASLLTAWGFAREVANSMVMTASAITRASVGISFDVPHRWISWLLHLARFKEAPAAAQARNVLKTAAVQAHKLSSPNARQALKQRLQTFTPAVSRLRETPARGTVGPRSTRGSPGRKIQSTPLAWGGLAGEATGLVGRTDIHLDDSACVGMIVPKAAEVSESPPPLVHLSKSM